MTKAKLIVFAGLPGVGKTTIARAVASRIGGVFLRIDVIEQAVLRSVRIEGGIGPIGYLVGQDLAVANLEIGRTVVVDAVNAVMESRLAWRAVARQARADIVEIEVVCGDPALHRVRLEARKPDIAGHRLPDWAKVRSMAMEPWDREHIVIDTAAVSADDATATIVDSLAIRTSR